MHPRMKWLIVALAVGAILFGIGSVIAVVREDGIAWPYWWVIPAGVVAMIAYFGLRVETQQHHDDIEHDEVQPDERPPAL